MTREPLEANLNAYRHLVVSVESYLAEDVSKEIEHLEQIILSDLGTLGLFDDITAGKTTPPSDETLCVRVLITDLDRVSGTSRFFLGALAGKASMTADVTFLDGSTGGTLGAYTIVSQSGGTGMSRGTGAAVEKTAQEIVALIQREVRR